METLGYTWESADSLEQALLAIKEAAENDRPFSVITIDMKFEIGKGEMRMGKTRYKK